MSLGVLQNLRRSNQGFSLVEILIAMFVLSMGMIMIAGSMPVALRTSIDSIELSSSELVARTAAQSVLATNGNINFSRLSSDIEWYSPAADAFAGDGVSPNPRPRFAIAGDPSILYPVDDRYGYQIFYRRNGTVEPFDWDVYIVVQVRREGVFGAPLGPAQQNLMASGDMYCDGNGVWRRWGREGGSYAGVGPLKWGVPAGVMVYQTRLRF